VAVIVGGAMLLQAVFAATVGLVIPLGLARIGIDPAVAAGPLTQMTCDVTGLLVYFSFARVVLKMTG
jgi:magnesium transporter